MQSTGGVLAAVLAVCAIMAILGPQSRAEGEESAASGGPPRSGQMAGFEPASDAKPLPGTAFTAADGSPHTLDEFRGRLVLVNFWATWCAPCVREMPSLDRLQAKLGGDGFTVIALSEDRVGWEKIGPFAERLGLKDLPLYHDAKSAMMFGAGVAGLPATILVGRDGREIGRLTGPAEWDGAEAVALIRHYLGAGE